METGHQNLRHVSWDDDVRLERREAAFHALAAELGYIVVRRELARVRHLPRAGARRAAMGPVHVNLVPRRTAEELVDRDPERLALEIEQRILESADRLLDHRAWALPSSSDEIPDDALDGTRVAAEDVRGEILNDAG